MKFLSKLPLAILLFSSQALANWSLYEQTSVNGLSSGWSHGRSMLLTESGHLYEVIDFVYSVEHYVNPKVAVLRDGASFKLNVEGIDKELFCRCLNCATTASPVTVANGPKPTLRASPEIDWFRSGLVLGPELEGGNYDHSPSFRFGPRFSVAALSWNSFYVLPFDLIATYSLNLWFNLAVTSEVGLFFRRGVHQFRCGLGAGFSYYGWGDRNVGFAIRPAIRYRRQWDGFGLEISLELPLNVQLMYWDAGRLTGYSPLLGISFGR